MYYKFLGNPDYGLKLYFKKETRDFKGHGKKMII